MLDNQTTPANVQPAPEKTLVIAAEVAAQTVNEIAAENKQAKVSKWFSLAGVVLQALASIFARKS